MQSQPSPAEAVKQNSHHLRGTVIEELKVDAPNFTKETVQVLKFHGIYQQSDRDARKEGKPAPYGSMVRVGIPGGVLTAEQYLVLDNLADQIGDGGLRITTRQDFQFHRVQKTDLHDLIRTINDNALSTLAACGDVVRNVTCCPAPLVDGHRAQLQPFVRSLAKRLKPKTKAYYEIWLDGEKAAAAESAEPEDEPLYGSTYLPRKFKVGFAAPGDNCIDVYTNDAGVVPVIGPLGLERFVILAGGGLGMSPGAKATHPRLADAICTVAPQHLEETVEAMVAIHRDFGNRSNRKLARLKYVIEEIGLDRFKAELESRVGRKLAAPEPCSWGRGDDHLGWFPQGDGAWFLGVPVMSGRIKDQGGVAVRTALREVVQRFRPGVRLTPHQNVLLAGVRHEDRGEIEATLQRHGVALVEHLPSVLKQALACPALPTCGLAITEAERVMPSIAADIQAELDSTGLKQAPVSVRITGCPNGCARPYTAEIGIVGQSVDMYLVYLGGSPLGTRLGFVFAENVKRTEIGSRLRPVFESYREARNRDESFGDYCHRLGKEALRSVGEPVLR